MANFSGKISEIFWLLNSIAITSSDSSFFAETHRAKNLLPKTTWRLEGCWFCILSS
jgi:hypothetical protein